MKNKKLNVNIKFLSPILLLVLFSCGSFDSSSLVSSDGIYAGKESSLETIKPSSDYFKNYFSDEANKYDFDLSQNDSLNFDSSLISSEDIAYSNNNPSWGDIPNSVDYVIDYNRYNYRYRFYSPYFLYYDPYYSYYHPFRMSPFHFGYSYGGWYPYLGFGHFSPYFYHAFNSPYGYYYPYRRWGSQGWYGNASLFGYDIYNNYIDNTNVSYNRGRRGSSSNVVVYSNGRSSSANSENSERVRNYNSKRETLKNIANSKTNSNSRSYLDPRTSKMNGSQNLRNYINSGRIVNENGNKTIKGSTSRRYYNDLNTNNDVNSWGLSGRNGNVNSSRNSTSRSSSNWVNPSSARSSGSSSSIGRSYNYRSSSSSGISTNSGRSSSSSSRSGRTID